MPHDSPLPVGYTPKNVEGSMQLKELTNLCTKLLARVTSLETKLRKTKEVHGKALTKLVKKGRMEETEYADVEEENTGVEYDFDLTEQQVTPLKTPQVEEQSQEMFEAELSVLSAAKILARPIFEEEYKKVHTLFKKDSEVNKSEKKRVAEESLLQESFKKLRTAQALGSEPFHQEKSTEEPKELSEEDLEKMLEIVQVEEFRVEALQTKYPIIDWEIRTERSRKYWKIIRVGNITEAYQGFEDMLKAFDREDLDTLWSLIKEKFRSVAPTEDMERALRVELKRIYEPDKEDTMWKLQRYMHDPLTWRLYGSCAVHHVFLTRGHCIYMLLEKDYPLTTAVMMLMLSRRLQVEEDSEMARNLIKDRKLSPEYGEGKQPKKLPAKAPSTTKHSVPNVVLWNSTSFKEDDDGTKMTSSLSLKPNLSLKMGKEDGNGRFTDMILVWGNSDPLTRNNKVESTVDSKDTDSVAKLSSDATLLDKPLKETSNIGGKDTRIDDLITKYMKSEDLPPMPLLKDREDTDWKRADDLLKTSGRAEVEMIHCFFWLFDRVFPYHNLATKWKFIAFESWLRRKGLDPSTYKKSLGIIGNYNATSEEPEKIEGELSSHMDLEDLFADYLPFFHHLPLTPPLSQARDGFLHTISSGSAKPDLSFSSLEEFVNEPIVSEPTVKKPIVKTSEAKASIDKPKVVRKNFGPPIIED
ncbi:hypothetical protein Tco_0127694 [Tanacetum coccineum]